MIVEAIYVYSGDEFLKPHMRRGVAPEGAEKCGFMYNLLDNTYYDYVCHCWGRPVYRQRKGGFPPEFFFNM